MSACPSVSVILDPYPDQAGPRQLPVRVHGATGVRATCEYLRPTTTIRICKLREASPILSIRALCVKALTQPRVS